MSRRPTNTRRASWIAVLALASAAAGAWAAGPPGTSTQAESGGRTSAEPGARAADAPADPDPLAALRAEAERRAAELAPGRGLVAVVELASSGSASPALALVEALLAPERAETLRGVDRAALEAARGWLLFQVEPALAELDVPLEGGALDGGASARFEAARAAFGRARSEAGAGEVRRRAVASLATVELYEAERALRAFLTELQAGPGGGASAPGPGGAAEEQVDPLERVAALRGEFVEARDLFVERLRLGREAVDPRANLEWTMRRLRELDALRDELEQQQQEQEQQQPSDEGEQDEQGDESQEQDPQAGEGEQGQDPESGEEQDPEPGEDQQPGDGEGEEEGEQPEAESGDERGDDEGAAPEPTEEAGDEQGEGETPAGAATEEAPLSQEEITLLLDRLAEIEAEAERRRASVRRRGRAAVERDW